MYLYTHNRTQCCGCGGCQQICPKHCISMTLLDDGFEYPIVDRKHCVDCGKCIEVCPIYQAENRIKGQQSNRCYFGWHKNKDIRMKSTSGGTFTAIAELVLRNKISAIYGALYDDNWSVRHRGVTTLDGLKKLRQSKYVQSEIGNCYSEIKNRLHNDEHVLFCGTPCQVDGLKHFLGKKYEKLLLVDLVCHGVTSPALFKKYIESLEQKEGKYVTKVRFRDKVKKGNILSLAYTTIIFENGKTKSSECNLYLRAYMEGLMQRPCCEKCPYACLRRSSDITLGDFWGIEMLLPKLRDELSRGISLILANTEKGSHFINQLTDKMYIVETDISYALTGKNMQLEKPVEVNEKKRDLYQNVLENGVQITLLRKLGIRYLIRMYLRWCLSNFKAYLPKKIYGWMVSLKRSLTKVVN